MAKDSEKPELLVPVSCVQNELKIVYFSEKILILETKKATKHETAEDRQW